MNNQVLWFCYHAVGDGLLTSEQCVAVANAIREAGIEGDLQTFAQAIVDNELCTDVETIEKLMAMATTEARTIGPPPDDVLAGATGVEAQEVTEESAEPAADEEPAEDEEPAVAAAPVPPPPRPGGMPPPPKGRMPPPPRGMPPPPKGAAPPAPPAAAKAPRPEAEPADAPAAAVPGPRPDDDAWCRGWPGLSRAETATATDAKILMHEFLTHARNANCSDVHVSAGARPFVRHFKNVYLLMDQQVLSPEATANLNLSLLNEHQREVFDKTHDLDYSYAVNENDRYRTNVLLQRLGVAGAYRVLDNKIRTLRELGFARPEVLERLTTYHQGLVLVTGPAGCGKSTTLAAFVDMINTTRRDHIITIEDPIEIVHTPKGCNITQREVGDHTRSFGNALRAALREDPDIIVIGELRDLETIEMAIRASETGHLVFGTLHTGSAATTMDRVLDVFPPSQQAQVRAMAAESLKGVICQQLLTNADGTGLAMAAEIMLGTLAVSNIVREGETFKLPSIIQTGYNIGMSTMEQSYFDLYMSGQQTYDQTLPRIQNKDLITQMQVREAQRAEAAVGKKKKKGWF